MVNRDFHVVMAGRNLMIREIIQKYQPKNEQEKTDQIDILRFMDANPDFLFRTNLAGHLTSSAIVVNQSMDKILFAFHNIYQSWSWVGGHNDGDPDCLQVAMRETREETGVKNLRPWSDDIFMIDVIYVRNHIKRRQYVPDHLHFNVAYLLIADEMDQLSMKPDENSGVRWFALDDVLNHVNEDRMVPVYQKAMMAIRNLK